MSRREVGRDEAVRVRRDTISLPIWLQVVGWLLRRLVGLTRFVCQTPLLWVPLAYLGVLVVVGVRLGDNAVVITFATTCAVITGTLIVWRLRWPDSFRRIVADWVRAQRRRVLVYRRYWTAGCEMAGLARTRGNELQGVTLITPKLGKVRSTRFIDRVWVKMLPGQTLTDWQRETERLAQVFGAEECRVYPVPGRHRMIIVKFRVRDALAEIVPPVPPADLPNLSKVPVGRTEDGDPFLVRLLGAHLLLIGAMGSGKSWLIWAIIYQLLPAVRARLVSLWALDPKGGMELGPGRPLFDEFCYGAAREGENWVQPFLALLKKAEQTMRERQNRLMAAHQRDFTPSPGNPLIVIFIDEVLAVTAWVTDRNLKRELENTLGLLLSEGRATGICLVTASQDPHKQTLDLIRDLTPIRVLLRVIETAHIDLTFGMGARERGARADLIPEATPGVGYVQLDGKADLLRVRVATTTDLDIAEMVTRHQTEIARPVFPIGDAA